MIGENKKDEIIDQRFRDAVATIDKKGKRNYLFPKKPKGKLYNKRTIFSIFYLIIFFSLPWIKLNGEPFVMLNILERKFIIFGQIFGPQDFFIFALGMLTFLVFIILLPSFLAGYFVDGLVHKPSSWKWFFGKSNIGLKGIIQSNNN
jgi:polyferredoxin